MNKRIAQECHRVRGPAFLDLADQRNLVRLTVFIRVCLSDFLEVGTECRRRLRQLSSAQLVNPGLIHPHSGLMRQMKAFIHGAVAVDMSVCHGQVISVLRSADDIEAVPVRAGFQIGFQRQNQPFHAVQRAFRLGPARAQKDIRQRFLRLKAQIQLPLCIRSREFAGNDQIDIRLFPNPVLDTGIRHRKVVLCIDHPGSHGLCLCERKPISCRQDFHCLFRPGRSCQEQKCQKQAYSCLFSFIHIHVDPSRKQKRFIYNRKILAVIIIFLFLCIAIFIFSRHIFIC